MTTETLVRWWWDRTAVGDCWGTPGWKACAVCGDGHPKDSLSGGHTTEDKQLLEQKRANGFAK